MPRVRQGTTVEKNGKWYGRVRYALPSGKRMDVWMQARDKTHAAKLVQEKINELKVTGEQEVNNDRVTFKQLAEKYRERKIFPARIINGRKVAGLKSVAPVLVALKALVEGFGNRRIKSITHSDIEAYKLHRLETPAYHGGQRQISSVNRELELMRAMFRFAIREGWLMRSPFEMGAPLISKADETRRERILSPDEERRLLAACVGRRAHLRPLLIAALDTSARRGELFKLRWREVDLEARTITILAGNSKTARARTIGITPRLHAELCQLRQAPTQDADGLVFGVTDTVKTAWKTLCREARIEGLHFHDLRHTAITRMVQTRQPSALIMKVSGHTQHATFARYVNPDAEAVLRVADALSALNVEAGLSDVSSAETQEHTQASEMVN